MVARERTAIQPFNGSLAHANGLLDVERAAFDECPYSVKEIQTMLTNGPQRAWLALARESVIGFVIAFCTAGLQDPFWEIDLLAVHPKWQGMGLGTRLIRASTASNQNLPRRARAFVSTDNMASAHAFARAGLRPVPAAFTLLIYRTDRPVQGKKQVAKSESGVSICETLRLSKKSKQPVTSLCSDENDSDLNLTVLQAEQNGQPAGYVELLGVQTLLYRGLWIESIHTQEQAAREALINGALVRASETRFDEVGAMVKAQDEPLRDALFAAGFRSLGEFRRYTADLPLPGLAN